MPKLPESTRRKQAIFDKGSLFYSHCEEGLAAASGEFLLSGLPYAGGFRNKSHDGRNKCPIFQRASKAQQRS
jgi:hypothetical protein